MTMTDPMEQLLSKLYYSSNSPVVFAPLKHLLAEAQKSLPQLKARDVQKWLSNQITYTIHKPVRRRFERARILASHVNEMAQADLIEMKGKLPHKNEGINYVLTFIDVFSKKAYAVPIKTKTKGVVAKALDSILEKHPIGKLQTDEGKEFLNSDVKAVTIKHHVHHFTTKNKIKCAIAERFNSTIKKKFINGLPFHLIEIMSVC